MSRSLSALRLRGLWAIALFAALGPGCAQRWLAEAREGIREGVLELDEAQVQDIRRALTRVPVIEEEAFPDYLPRARAALIASSDRNLQALSYEIPDDPALGLPPAVEQAMPVLVARWARGRRRTERVESLLAAMRYRTVAPKEPGAEPPPAFDALMTQVSQTAVAGGLGFTDVERLAWEVSLPPTAPPSPGPTGEAVWPAPVGFLAHADVRLPGAGPAPPTPGATAGGEGAVIGVELEEDRVVGPGALNNKGPLVALLSAMSALKASRLWFHRGATLVVETRQTTTGEGLKTYRGQRGLPPRVVGVDGRFPVGVPPPALAPAPEEPEEETSGGDEGPRPDPDETEELVAALLEAYTTVTGAEGEPAAVPAGSLAARVPGAVSFGPRRAAAKTTRPEEETLRLEELDDLVEMYAFAIARLGL